MFLRGELALEHDINIIPLNHAKNIVPLNHAKNTVPLKHVKNSVPLKHVKNIATELWNTVMSCHTCELCALIRKRGILEVNIIK